MAITDRVRDWNGGVSSPDYETDGAPLGGSGFVQGESYTDYTARIEAEIARRETERETETDLIEEARRTVIDLSTFEPQPIIAETFPIAITKAEPEPKGEDEPETVRRDNTVRQFAPFAALGLALFLLLK